MGLSHLITNVSNSLFEFVNSNTGLQVKRLDNSLTQSDKIYRIGLLSDFIYEPTEQAIAMVLAEMKIGFEIVIFQQESIELQILDPESEIYKSGIDILVVYPDYSKSLSQPNANKFSSPHGTEQQFLDRWTQLWSIVNERLNIEIIQHDLIEVRTFNGNLNLLSNMNSALKQVSPKNVTWVEISRAARQISDWMDYRLLEIARIPFSPRYMYRYYGEFHYTLRLLMNKPIKLIITDLDDVMWNGVLAEEGPDGLRHKIESTELIDGLSIANVLCQALNEGYLLAISSKNNLADVKALFSYLDTFPLNIDDFVAIKANWESKTINILQILKHVGFHPENVLFLDDSKTECLEVKTYFPEMSVILVEQQQEITKSDFENLGFLRVKKLTNEDKSRNKSYFVSNQLGGVTSLKDRETFLSSLNMQVLVSHVAEKDTPRIQQMFERTNQFRANTLSWESILALSELHQFKLTLSDKYTDYGIVAYIALTIKGDSIVINQWLMSCRVFGRGLEKVILEECISMIGKTDFFNIKIDYAASDRNLYFKNSIIEFDGDLIEGYKVFNMNRHTL